MSAPRKKKVSCGCRMMMAIRTTKSAKAGRSFGTHLLAFAGGYGVARAVDHPDKVKAAAHVVGRGARHVVDESKKVGARAKEAFHSTKESYAAGRSGGRHLTMRQRIGAAMHHWHNGTDAIYAVGSYYYNDEPYPKLEVLEEAREMVDKLALGAKHGAHGWTAKDERELRSILKFLDMDIARARRVASSHLYHTAWFHKISNPGGKPTKGADIHLPDSAFSDRNKLAAAMRKTGILAPGERLSAMRVEGDKVIVFSTGRAIWHSMILTRA